MHGVPGAAQHYLESALAGNTRHGEGEVNRISWIRISRRRKVCYIFSHHIGVKKVPVKCVTTRGPGPICSILLMMQGKGMGTGNSAACRGGVNGGHSLRGTNAPCGGEPVDILAGIFCVAAINSPAVEVNVVFRIKLGVPVLIVDRDSDLLAQVVDSDLAEINPGHSHTLSLEPGLSQTVDTLF